MIWLSTLDSQLSTFMHIFLYEWATGGGLVEEPGPLPASLVREGAAMIGALAADLRADRRLPRRGTARSARAAAWRCRAARSSTC